VKQLIAMTEIHVTEVPGKPGDRLKSIAPIPPKVRVIPATSVFKAADAAQEKEFIDMGAARVAETEDRIEKAEVIDLSGDGATQKSSAKQAAEADVAELEAARAAYRDAFGEEAHGKAKAETLRGKVEDKAKADAEAAGMV